MSWNYPPGVTGNEPEIAGEDHTDECLDHNENTDDPFECICEVLERALEEDAAERAFDYRRENP